MKQKFTRRSTHRASQSERREHNRHKRLNQRGTVLPLVLVVMVLAVVPLLSLFSFHGQELQTAARYRDHEACLVQLDSGVAQCKSQIEQNAAYTGETLTQKRGRVTIEVSQLNETSWFFTIVARCGRAQATQNGTITLQNGRAEVTGKSTR
ncbi:MAG: hypothetical protein ACOX1H_02080 [Pseudoramibacter sp.]|jgi:Tfp pilus assembly protein PilV